MRFDSLLTFATAAIIVRRRLIMIFFLKRKKKTRFMQNRVMDKPWYTRVFKLQYSP